jgi:hypothetical protein
MQFENPLTFVRSMKGAPISILVACMFARKALSNLELQMWTNYNDEAITKAARLLCTMGWLTAVGRQGPWSLSEGRQLPLMDIADELVAVAGSDPVFPDRRSSSSQRDFEVTSYLPQEQEEGERSGFSGSLLAALDAANIKEPKRSELARLAHVTPDLIAAHVEAAKREGFPLGTAIYRIQYDWAVDLTIVKRSKSPNGHDRSCICRECRNSRDNVAMGTHCPDCWKTLNDECRCSESEEA